MADISNLPAQLLNEYEFQQWHMQKHIQIYNLSIAQEFTGASSESWPAGPPD